MNNIQDLHFRKEILPLFDFVYNEFSREALIELLSEMPHSIGDVLYRQQVIKGLLGHEALYTSFPYHKTECMEVYGYLQNASNRNTHLEGTSLKIHLFFAKSERHRERGQLGQVVLFFFKIFRFYFSNLNEEQFPVLFGKKIKKCKLFLSDFEIVKYEAIVRNRGFNVSEIAVLTGLLRQKIRNGEMAVFWKDFFLFEAYLSISKGIRRYEFVFPTFTNNELSIVNFYHPLIKEPVKNSLRTRANVTLLTGPNMSGKSTLLKAIGLCVFFAQLGLAVPAEHCELPFFDYVSISINLNDDLKSGFSHFMAEIKSLKNVILAAGNGKKCFAVFDELFRGTNIEDALAISKTTVAGLMNFSNSYFFISTHLHQLKEDISLHGNEIDTYFLECKLEGGKPKFTYMLRRGWSDLKIGQLLFDQEGLNELLAKK